MHQYPLHSAYLTIRTNRYCRMEEYGLHTYNDCIHSYINANKHFFTGYGSEFRPWSHLKPLLLHHQNWLTLLQQLQNGSKWPLQPISDSDRCTKKHRVYCARQQQINSYSPCHPKGYYNQKKSNKAG